MLYKIIIINTGKWSVIFHLSTDLYLYYIFIDKAYRPSAHQTLTCMGIVAVRAGLYSSGAGTDYCSDREDCTQAPHPAEWDKPDRENNSNLWMCELCETQ